MVNFMKARFFLLLISLIFLLGSVIFFETIQDITTPVIPTASVTGGYYDDPFVLQLSASPGETIYYTTDGSLPTTDSFLYKDGILISNRSQTPDIYNTIPRVIKDWKTFSFPTSLANKGTVIRAVSINRYGFASEVLSETYFVGLTPPVGDTLSIIFEEEDLFGENGIYVTGTAYDAWYLNPESSGQAPVPNFQQHLEIPAFIQLLENNHTLLSQSVNLRIQGSTKRLWPKKQFILKSQTDYRGNYSFNQPLYDQISTHSVMLKQELVDAFVHDIVSDRSISCQRSRPVSVYLNGEFWYDSYMLERYDKQYFQEYYNVNDVILIKNGTSEDGADYHTFMQWVSDSDFSDPQTYEALQAKIDVQSYIDYISVNYYLANRDFSENKNYVLWQSTHSNGDGYNDGRYRWCIYDIDILSHTRNASDINTFYCDTSLTGTTVRDLLLFRSLKQNPDYCKQFTLSFMDIVNNNFSKSNMERILTKYGYDLSWNDNFFLERSAYAAQHLAEEFALSGSLETVNIYCSQPESGSIILNTSYIDLSTGEWTGQYFTDYPITIKAEPKTGYMFIGWKGATTSTDPTITIPVDSGISLEAIFAPIP